MRGTTPKNHPPTSPTPMDSTSLVASYLADRARRWLETDIRRTRAGLARSAGLRAEQVHDLLDGVKRPSQRTMRALGRAVGVGLEELEEAASTWLRERAAAQPTKPAAVAPRRATPRRSPVVALSTPRPTAPLPDRTTRHADVLPARRDRYPNRARAVEAAHLLDHDERDIETVLSVILPPGATDPTPRAWMVWIEKAREERLRSTGRR